MGHRNLSRRDFLKLSGLAMASLTTGGMAFDNPKADGHSLDDATFGPVYPRESDRDHGDIARVAVGEIDLYARARDDSTIVGKRYRDQIVHIYEEVISPDGPAYNPLWYRVWGGYLHSAYLQKLDIHHNPPLSQVPESGQLAEVTVPFTIAYQYSPWQGWHPWEGANRLYHSTTHWITDVDEGPDGDPWYILTSEIDSNLKYFVPTSHLRPVTDQELKAISPNVPPEKKRIEVSIAHQTLKAFEDDELVFSTTISSGIPSRRVSPNDLPTATPMGSHRIYSKMPNKHMGRVSGNPDAEGGFSLPGVPWTCFFKHPGGYAFHGTYWHNNFGIQMSHGCVNMRNEDAKWLFCWCTPVFETPIESQYDWERRGNGTQVEVY